MSYARLLLLTCTAGALAGPLAPSTALGATTVGSQLAVNADITNESCGGGVIRCAVVNPSAIPVDGVLTQVRIRGAADDLVLLRVVRRTGPDAYVSAASSRLPSGATLSFRLKSGESQFKVRLPVRQGDFLALEGRGLPEALGPVDSGTSFGVVFSDSNDGATGVTDFIVDAELLIQGTVEADADGDGYGDETQDSCPTLREHQLPCAALAVSSSVSQPAVLPGGAAVVTTTVTNRGPSPSPEAQLQVTPTPPPVGGLAFEGASCTVAPTPVCKLPPLAVGASVTLTARAENVRAGFSLGASVIGPTVTPATWVLLPTIGAASGAVTVPTAGQLMLGARVLKGKTPRVEVTCPAATPDACTAALQIIGPKGIGRLSRVKTITIVSGRKATVALTLSREGTRILRKRGKLAARIQVTRTGVPTATPLVVTRAIRLTAAKRR